MGQSFLNLARKQATKHGMPAKIQFWFLCGFSFCCVNVLFMSMGVDKFYIHDNASWPTNIEYYDSIRVLKISEGCVWKESFWNMTWFLQMWSTSTTQKTWCHFVPKLMFACINSTMLLWRTEFDKVHWHTLCSIVASRCMTWPKVFMGAVESGRLHVITVLLSPISGCSVDWDGIRWGPGMFPVPKITKHGKLGSCITEKASNRTGRIKLFYKHVLPCCHVSGLKSEDCVFFWFLYFRVDTVHIKLWMHAKECWIEGSFCQGATVQPCFHLTVVCCLLQLLTIHWSAKVTQL